ncbi:hypothetical protein EBT23_05745 [bacterium]|nr:hypothetical protein [bacterium]
MHPLPHSPSLLARVLALGPWVLVSVLWAEPSLDGIAPTQTRLILAQAGTGTAAAVSSQAVATQPQAPVRADVTAPPTVPAPEPAQPKTNSDQITLQILDPRLDPDRPRNSQLDISAEQTLNCGGIGVVLPAGTYEQKVIVENPEDRRAIEKTSLKPQQIGLGYIRYLSDVPLKINGVERPGGLDIPIRKEDNLPVRIWYKKMTEPDDITKAFSFILPPIALVAGAGAWGSGNVLIPDAPPQFTEARDYYLKPLKPKPNPNETPKPASARPLGTFSVPGSSNLRSK